MRGYWLPQGHKKLSACDGFFIRSTAVYIGYDADTDWKRFLERLNTQITERFPDLTIVNEWRDNNGNMRYAVAENDSIQLITDDLDEYIAVYLIVPETAKESISAERFAEMLNKLKALLFGCYPDSLYHRENYRELKKVTEGSPNG